MNLTDIILLSVALGIDCFVVSFSQGIIFTSKRRVNSLQLAVTMGLFQGLMPVFGYFATGRMIDVLMPFSNLLVFIIFFILGSHFIFEAFNKNKEETVQCIGFKCLLGLGVATSIDALISGVTLKLTSADLLISCMLIGLISLLMSLCGFWIGNFVKQIPKKYLHICGGMILIILGVKSILSIF